MKMNEARAQKVIKAYGFDRPKLTNVAHAFAKEAGENIAFDMNTLTSMVIPQLVAEYFSQPGNRGNVTMYIIDEDLSGIICYYDTDAKQFAMSAKMQTKTLKQFVNMMAEEGDDYWLFVQSKKGSDEYESVTPN